MFLSHSSRRFHGFYENQTTRPNKPVQERRAANLLLRDQLATLQPVHRKTLSNLILLRYLVSLCVHDHAEFDHQVRRVVTVDRLNATGGLYDTRPRITAERRIRLDRVPNAALVIREVRV